MLVVFQEKTRKAIEKKVEEAEEEEKAAAVQEKRELFQRIKNEKMRVTRIENHLETVAEVGTCCVVEVSVYVT